MQPIPAALILALGLAACEQAPRTEPSPQPAATPQRVGSPATQAPATAPVSDSGVTPKLADIRIFRDWAIACDNGGLCEAASLAPGENGALGTGLVVRRASGPDGAVTVLLRKADGQVDTAAIQVDGKVVAQGRPDDDSRLLLTGDPARRLVDAMIAGRAASIRAGEPLALSLSGLSAAMRYADDRQGRVGTVTALVARGDRPASTVPAAPALPVVRAAAITTVAPEIPTAAAIAGMRRQLECPADDFGPVSQDGYRLDARTTLVLLSCGAGAYNMTSRPLLLRDGKLIPAPFDVAVDFGEAKPAGTPATLVNAGWAADAGVLTSWAKGRGLGDCGSLQRFAWDGERVRLVEARAMTECRGAIDLVSVWRANVVR